MLTKASLTFSLITLTGERGRRMKRQIQHPEIYWPTVRLSHPHSLAALYYRNSRLARSLSLGFLKFDSAYLNLPHSLASSIRRESTRNREGQYIRGEFEPIFEIGVGTLPADYKVSNFVCPDSGWMRKNRRQTWKFGLQSPHFAYFLGTSLSVIGSGMKRRIPQVELEWLVCGCIFLGSVLEKVDGRGKGVILKIADLNRVWVGAEHTVFFCFRGRRWIELFSSARPWSYLHCER